MDSYLGDEFSNGRRLRPATLRYALKNYPKVIIWLHQGVLNVKYTPSATGCDVVSVSHPKYSIYSWSMVLSDFEKCRSIANSVTIPLFPSYKMQDYEDMVKAQIRIKFNP